MLLQSLYFYSELFSFSVCSTRSISHFNWCRSVCAHKSINVFCWQIRFSIKLSFSSHSFLVRFVINGRWLLGDKYCCFSLFRTFTQWQRQKCFLFFSIFFNAEKLIAISFSFNLHQCNAIIDCTLNKHTKIL